MSVNLNSSDHSSRYSSNSSCSCSSSDRSRNYSGYDREASLSSSHSEYASNSVSPRKLDQLYKQFDRFSVSDSDLDKSLTFRDSDPVEMQEIKMFWKELLRAIPHNRHSITPAIAEKLAQVVHDHFEHASDTYYVRKTLTSPRHVFIDKTNKQAYVFSKNHGRKLPGGVDKTPSDVIHLKFDQKVPSTAEHKICLATNDHVYSECEIKLEQRFGLPCEFVSYKGKDGKIKTKMIQEAYDGDLTDFEDTFSPTELFKIFSDIVKHLNEMHSQGFVHGDIKFENVIVKRTPDGTVTARLADFGFTHNLTTEFPKDQILDKSYGTQRYTAPERHHQKHLLDNPLEQGQAEDMFAMGCLLMRMVYGRNVVEPKANGITLWKHLKYNMPERHPTALGIELDDLARDLFNNKPGKRITVQQLADRLTEMQMDKPAEVDEVSESDEMVIGEEYVVISAEF